MHLLITGATGLIGRRLVLDRLAHGDRLTVVCRDPGAAARLFAATSNPNVQVVEGDVSLPGPWQQAIDGTDAVVHLAGAGIADRRWTRAYRREIETSRLHGTHHVVNAIEDARRPPSALVAASAVGFYGDTGRDEVDERSPAGSGFLPELCVRWETQAMHATTLGARTVLLRIGVVLDDRGGFLGSVLPVFRMGLGGRLGSGRQYVSWIHWRDVVGMIDLALREPGCQGPMNVVAPNPITNRELTRALARAIGRPAFIPVPRPVLRLAAGKLASFLVTGQRAMPAAAMRHGYRFVHPEIARAMRAIFGVEELPTPPAPVRPENVRAAANGTGARERSADRRDDADAPGVAMPTEPIRLLAVDVDGTLLRSDGRLAEPVADALRRAEKHGCAVVLATARAPQGTRSIAQSIGLAAPVINFNGALIWNPIDERMQYHEAMAGDLAAAVVEAARTCDPRTVVEIDVLDRSFTDRLDPRFPPESLRLVVPDAVGPLDRILAAPVTKVNLIGEEEPLAEVAALVRDRFWRTRQVALFHSHPNLLQVTAPLVDKGIALQRIARRLRIGPAAVAVIGDAGNDLGMMEWCGFPIAVANASPEVRAMASAVVPTNDENGVAVAVDRFVVGASASLGDSRGGAVERR